MKNHLLILSLVTFCNLSFGQIINDETAFYNYTYDKIIIQNNKIENVLIKSSLSNGTRLGKRLFHFDTEGVLEKQVIIDSSGIPLSEIYFKTNQRKDLVLRIHNDFELNKTDTVIYFKKYEGDNLIKDSSSEIPTSYCYEYDKNKRLIKTIINSNFGLENNIKRIIIYTRDSLGRTINVLETIYQNEKDKKGTPVSNRSISYNKKGKIVLELEKYKNNKTWMFNKGSTTYSYNSSGNLIQIIRTNTSTYKYRFNGQGLITILKTSIEVDENKMDLIDQYNYTLRQ